MLPISDPALEAQTVTPLLDVLRSFSQQTNAPFYTPGHKRGQGISSRLADLLGTAVFRSDLPELPGLDNLFAPQGAILAAQELAAQAFGAEQTWFLVNGSTCGILAAILATCNAGDKILLPRNVHQSAIAALVLSGAIPIFLQPEYDPELDLAHSICPHDVAMALEQHPNTKAVFMVYPTYYGVCGDVAAIAQIAHQHGIPLLVDEAHAPHFAFHPDLPSSALAAGADLTVQSTHKVLSAMTQASMLHVQGKRVDRDRLRNALQLVQSTSPSYLLLASLDAARHQIATQGQALLSNTLKLAAYAQQAISHIPGLTVLGPEQAGLTPGFCQLDPTRLTVRVSKLGIDGFAADELLHQTLGITAEMPSLQHLTFIVSLGNTETDIKRLIHAFKSLAANALVTQDSLPSTSENKVETTQKAVSTDVRSHQLPHTCPPSYPLSPPTVSPRDAFFAATEPVAIAQACHRISAEWVCPYPPGIPVLLPGEMITPDALKYLQRILEAGGFISGCADPQLNTLRVIQSGAI